MERGYHETTNITNAFTQVTITANSGEAVRKA